MNVKFLFSPFIFSLCNISLLSQFVISICYISLLSQFVISIFFYICLLSQFVLSLCYLSLLSQYVISVCYLSLLSHYVISVVPEGGGGQSLCRPSVVVNVCHGRDRVLHLVVHDGIDEHSHRVLCQNLESNHSQSQSIINKLTS